MEIDIESLSPPLRRDASGALRVGSSRVLVELVLRAFQDGSTPEAIVQRFPTMTLADALQSSPTTWGIGKIWTRT